MRVHGLDGLRVVDASAMPYVTNGNIYAPVMMVAEKAADLILGNTPLPPEPIPFYRHGAGMPLDVPGRGRGRRGRSSPPVGPGIVRSGVWFLHGDKQHVRGDRDLIRAASHPGFVPGHAWLGKIPRQRPDGMC